MDIIFPDCLLIQEIKENMHGIMFLSMLNSPSTATKMEWEDSVAPLSVRRTK